MLCPSLLGFPNPDLDSKGVKKMAITQTHGHRKAGIGRSELLVGEVQCAYYKELNKGMGLLHIAEQGGGVITYR